MEMAAFTHTLTPHDIALLTHLKNREKNVLLSAATRGVR